MQCGWDDECSAGGISGIMCSGNMGAKGARVKDIVSNISIRSKPKARTDSRRTSSRTETSTSRRTRPESSRGTWSSPTSSPLRSTSKIDRKIRKRTSTLSTGRGVQSKTTSTNKMATVSFQTVKDLVQIYHGLGEQTIKKIRSQSASLRCGIGRELYAASQPGLDRMQRSHLIGCAEDGGKLTGLEECGQG